MKLSVIDKIRAEMNKQFNTIRYKTNYKNINNAINM